MRGSLSSMPMQGSRTHVALSKRGVGSEWNAGEVTFEFSSPSISYFSPLFSLHEFNASRFANDSRHARLDGLRNPSLSG